MKTIMNQNWLKRIIRWLLVVVMVMYFVTGFGITEFRIVEALSFGLLTKSIAFKIHYNLWIPLIVLLGLHLSLSSLYKSYLKYKNAKTIDKRQ